jgi:hypothetical protein
VESRFRDGILQIGFPFACIRVHSRLKLFRGYCPPTGFGALPRSIAVTVSKKRSRWREPFPNTMKHCALSSSACGTPSSSVSGKKEMWSGVGTLYRSPLAVTIVNGTNGALVATSRISVSFGCMTTISIEKISCNSRSN